MTTLIFLVAMVAACAGSDSLTKRASREGWQEGTLRAMGFTLRTLQRGDPLPGTPLHIYLAGDGRPWRGTAPNSDPTGRGDMVLTLLAADPVPAIYLGRPCYHQHAMPDVCDPDLWTGSRYSQAIVDTLADALRQLAERHRPSQLVLVGHSGGGVLAALAAEALPGDIPVAVITLAANLDTGAWTRFHGHLPLSGSLNPALLPMLRPRVHFHGSSDIVVPLQTLSGYREQHPEAPFEVIAGCGHSDCWPGHWPQLLQRGLALASP